MANEVIGIEVQVKLEQLRAQLATLGPGMEKEAKAMTAALNREIKQQTAAMKKLGDSATTAGVGFDKLSGNASKAVQVSGALGGVVGKLNPELGTAVTSVGALTGVMQGLSSAGALSMAALGPIAGVLAAGAAAYYYFASALEEAEAAQAKMADTATRAQKAHGDLKTVVQDVTDAYEVSVGITDSAAVSQRKSIEKVNEAFAAEAAAIKASALEAGSMTASLQSLDAKRRGTIALIEETTELELAAAEAAKARAAADRRAAAASRDAAAAAKEAADTAALYARDEAARNETAFDERVAEARKAVKAVQKQLDEEKAAKEKAAQEDIDRAEKTAQAEIEARVAVKSASLSIMGSATDALMLLSDNLGESNKKAALDAFNAAKALAIATAVVNAALGVTNALATGGAAAPVLAVAAGVSGAVSVATIAATEPPAFAAGGFIDGAPTTGVPITAHPNEAILNQQGRASIGDDAIRAANAGRGGEGGMTVSMIYKHKVFDYFVRDNLRTGGPLASAVRRGDRVGQLRRGRG